MEALSLPSSRNPAISSFMAGGKSRYFHGQLAGTLAVFYDIRNTIECQLIPGRHLKEKI